MTLPKAVEERALWLGEKDNEPAVTYGARKMAEWLLEPVCCNCGASCPDTFCYECDKHFRYGTPITRAEHIHRTHPGGE